LSEFNTWIDSFAGIWTHLPLIIRIGTVGVIALFALIPFSLILLIFDSSTRSVLERLANYLKLTYSDLFEGINSHVNACTKIIEQFIEDNSVKYEFKPNLKDVDISKAQEAVDLIDEQGRSFPGLIAARLEAETDRYEEFEGRLNTLEAMTLDPIDISVPNYSVLESAHDKLRKGITDIMIFAPLAFLVIILNTYLLNMYFSELPGIDEIRISKTLGLYISHILAFALSAVEFGIGAYSAAHYFEKGKEQTETIIEILNWMVWIVFLSLVLFEGFIYFQISHRLTMDEVAISKMSISQLILGGWLAIFAPIIVVGLFIFGHKFATGVLNYRAVTSVKKFKRELDDAHHKSTQSNEALSQYNAELMQSVKDLRDYRIASQEAPDMQPPESSFLSELDMKITDARSILGDFQAAYDFSEQSVVVEVNRDERKKNFYMMSFFLALVATAISISIITMVPLLENHTVLSNLPMIVIYCIPTFGILSSIVIGYFWSNQTVMQVGEDIVSHPKSYFMRIGLGLSALFLVALVVYICLIYPSEKSYATCFLIIACMTVMLFLGPSIRVMLDTLIALARLAWRGIRIAIQWSMALITQCLWYLVNVIQAILEICSKPALLIREVFFRRQH